MTTTDAILSILESMASGSDPMLKTVLYESAFGGNVRLDRKPTPSAIVYLLQSWRLDTERGLKHREVDAEVFFCERADLNAKGDAIKGVMDSLEPIVDEFVSLLLSEPSFEVSEIRATAAYGKFDTNVCGYSLQFTAVERQGVCYK